MRWIFIDGDVEMIIIMIDGMKKRKAGSTNSTKTIIILKKIE